MQARAIFAVALLAALPGLPVHADEPCVPVKPCEVPDQGSPQAREAPEDFAEQARQLSDLLSCQGRIPEGLDPAVVKAFCARQTRLLARRAPDRAALQALLQPLRPVRLPSAAVYPLSGSDLLGALAVYPDARNVTLTSSLPCGDPRVLPSLRDRSRLSAFLAGVAEDGERLLRGNKGEPPPPGAGRGALPLLLWALAADGDEPVGLKLFRVEPAGTLRYLSAAEIASMERAAPAPGPFDSCELAFVRRGEPAGTLPRLVRNVRADLSDAGVATDPGPLAHLATKGSFGAVLAGATALAGDGFSRLRELVLKRAVFTISDGTGPTPDQVKQAGLVQESHRRPGGEGTLVVIRRP
jgi:hypothetical protein